MTDKFVGTGLEPGTNESAGREQPSELFSLQLARRVLWVKTTYPDQLDYAEARRVLWVKTTYPDQLDSAEARKC